MWNGLLITCCKMLSALILNLGMAAEIFLAISSALSAKTCYITSPISILCVAAKSGAF